MSELSIAIVAIIAGTYDLASNKWGENALAIWMQTAGPVKINIHTEIVAIKAKVCLARLIRLRWFWVIPWTSVGCCSLFWFLGCVAEFVLDSPGLKGKVECKLFD